MFECFVFLKVQKRNLSPTLALNYTKATWRRVGLESYPFWILILRMVCSWNLHQRYFLRKILFSDVISFDSCIFHNWGIISADTSRSWKVTMSLVFFFQVNFLVKKIFISRYESWSVNSGWLTLFVHSKVTRGNSFDFKMLLTIFLLQEQSF